MLLHGLFLYARMDTESYQFIFHISLAILPVKSDICTYQKTKEVHDMVRKMNQDGKTRKALVAAIEELTGEKAIYRRMPTCNYDIGEITVLKDGSIDFPDGSDIIEQLAEMRFAAEPEQTELTIELPNTITETELDALKRLIASKATLIRKAVGAESLKITVSEDKVAFPWFTLTEGNEGDETATYTAFITALVDMVKRQKRIIATEKDVENEKYAFRCFLLRLGFIGDEYKAARKILLRNLTGSSAWKGGAPNAE
jgi:hypothetical protein